MVNKKKILLVVRWPVGGIRTFLTYVYDNFRPSDYYFTIVAPDLKEMQLLLSDLKQLNIRYCPVKENPTFLNLFWKVLKVACGQKFDIIHSHGFIAGLNSVFAAKLTRTPHLMSNHDVLNESLVTGVKGVLFKLLIPKIDYLHFVSKDAKDRMLFYIKSLKNKSNEKIVVIENGVDTKQFLNAKAIDLRNKYHLPENAFLVGYLGRFMSIKGFKFLIESIEILKSRDNLPKEPIVLAFGKGGFLEREKRFIKEKGLENFFLFLPFARNVGSILKGLDVLVMPSISEAFGLLAAEALVAGTPIIGTNCIGLRQVLANTPSSIVSPKNPKRIADEILKEMNYPSKAQAKEYIPDAVRRFDVSNRSREMENLYSLILKEYRWIKNR